MFSDVCRTCALPTRGPVQVDDEKDVIQPSRLWRTIAEFGVSAHVRRVEEAEHEAITCAAADRHLDEMRFFLLHCALQAYAKRTVVCGRDERLFYDLTGSCGMNALSVRLGCGYRPTASQASMLHGWCVGAWRRA